VPLPPEASCVAESLWLPARLEDRPLTVLVTDIRKSSRTLNGTNPSIVSDFLNAFISRTYEALKRVVPNQGKQQEDQEYKVDRFLGDGFLVLFYEPDPKALAKVGPVRATQAAREMLRLFRQLRNQRKFQNTYPAFSGLRLSAGINYGSVLYGPIGGQVPMDHTALVENVILAFRIAKYGPAEDDEIFASGKAQPYIWPHFEMERVFPNPSLEGFDEPQPVWRILSPRSRRGG
jgi:class 3 adenylate cyclase